jgi:tetratricopeptide (TPR) repeat protein
MWVGLIGVAATIPLVQAVAVAKSQVEIAETARTITVLITSANSQGSGVILKHEGDVYTVLTAAHVVKKKINYKITTPDEQQHQVISSSIVSAPGDIDLAVVKFKAITKYPIAKLGNCNILKRGMEVYVAGFPANDKAFTSPILLGIGGKILGNSNNKIQVHGYSLVYSNDTLPGMSGGAVLNNDGELVAIHGEGDKVAVRASGDKEDKWVKSGHNLGISIELFGTVASRMGIELGGQVAAITQNTELKADDYLVSGVNKHDKGDIQGALADYSSAIQLDPNYANAYYNRGLLKYYKLKDTQGALADYNKFIQINSYDARGYVLRGVLKKHERDYPGALADYNRAIKIDPGNLEAYDNRAMLKADILDDYQGALVDFNVSAELYYSYNKYFLYKSEYMLYSIYYDRAMLKADKLHDYPGALADFNMAEEKLPRNYPFPQFLYEHRAELKAEKLHDYPGALADYKKWMTITPSAVPYRLHMDILSAKYKSHSEALAVYDNVIKIGLGLSLSLDPTLNLVDAYYERGLLRYSFFNNQPGAISDMQEAARRFKAKNDDEHYQTAIDLLKKWQQSSGT